MRSLYELKRSTLGQSIAVVNNPPLITIHSLQTGQQERTISIPSITSDGPSKLTGIWWFKEHRFEKKEAIPDIFKRAGDIVRIIFIFTCLGYFNREQTGSAHGLLKTQPLLDALHDDSQPLSFVSLPARFTIC